MSWRALASDRLDPRAPGARMVRRCACGKREAMELEVIIATSIPLYSLRMAAAGSPLIGWNCCDRNCISFSSGGERLSGLSSCIGILGPRFASFCVESDEELAGECNANDHFFFTGLEQPIAELAQAVIVAGGNGGDEEEDRADAGAATAGGSLTLSLAAVICDGGEAGKLGNGFVRQFGMKACNGASGNALHLAPGLGELCPQRIVVDHGGDLPFERAGLALQQSDHLEIGRAHLSAIEHAGAALLLDRKVVGDLPEPCYQGL